MAQIEGQGVSPAVNRPEIGPMVKHIFRLLLHMENKRMLVCGQN